VSQLVRNQGCNSRLQGVYLRVEEYILNQGYLGCPKLSAIARARPTVKYGSDTTWNEPNFRERKPDSLHLRDSPKKRLSRAIPVSSGTNPYNTSIKETLLYIITTSDYNSSAQAMYKSIRTESRKVKYLHNGSIEAKRLQLHYKLEHRTRSSLHTFVVEVAVIDGHQVWNASIYLISG
jgi:hypothetical protein